MAKRLGLGAALAHAAAGKQKTSAIESDPHPSTIQPDTEAATRTTVTKPIGASKDAAKSYREGRVNVTGYFSPAVKQSLRLIQAKHPGLTVQELLAEALDDLFAKYNVPQSARVTN